MLPPERVLNDRYRLMESVGEGGMASVYRAVDTRLGRTVAIKVLHQQFERDQPFLQRFQQEAEFAASLGSHPNIVAIYDIGKDEGFHYIVMEFVEGSTLKELINDRAPFGVQEACSIGAQIGYALDFAHKRGLIHRDVKPQNIMVTPQGTAKVTDFGIARSISASQLTRTGMVIGTVHYFSPEQAQGKPATPESDIYSLGIIMYEMLTGHLPFDAENPIGVAMQHLHSDPPSPWDYNPGLPTRLVGTIMRALEKDPEMRFPDAAEFAGALSNQPVPDAGHTTLFSPISVPKLPEHTAIYQAVEPVALPPPVQYVEEEPVSAAPPRARPIPATNRSRNRWLAMAGVLLAIIVGTLAFGATRHFLGGGTTATPTATIRPTATAKPPKKHHRIKPTVAVPVFVQPTVAPTLAPILPTSTSTPKPKPKPTAIPPTPTSPPPPATPTPIPTVVGPVATGTAVG